MKIDLDTYQWLVSLKILQPLTLFETMITLDDTKSEKLLNGTMFGEILSHLGQKIETKDSNTPGIRLFNWNNIQSALKHLEISLDDDIKLCIVKGDHQMIAELLKEIRSHTITFETQTQQSQSMPELATSKFQSVMVTEPQEIDVEKIDLSKQHEGRGSLLELIVATMCNNFKIKPRQAVALLENNHKELSNILISGQKGQFSQSVAWLTELSQCIPIVVRFQYHVETFYSLIRAGLISKSTDVVFWTLKNYETLTKNLQDIEDAYAWFVKEHGGLITTFLSLKRHPQFSNYICNLYAVISSYDINDFFNVQFRKILKSGKEYIDMINIIIDQMPNINEIQQAGLLDFFAQQATKLFDVQHSAMERMSALKYFENYWILDREPFENQHVEIFLLNARKATRDSNQTLRFYAFESLFRILDHLAILKDRYAALIYKKLVFSFIENFDEIEIREFLIHNLLYIVKKYSSIPIETLITPMIKQLSIDESEFKINIGDFQLLREACEHPKLQVELAVQMLDILGKIYLNSIVFAAPAFQEIQLLISRFLESPALQEITFNLIKISLQTYYENFSRSKQTNYDEFISANKDSSIINKQYRSQIIKLVKFVIYLKCFPLNEQIRLVVAHFHLEIKQNLKSESKAINMILETFGDPEETFKLLSLSQKFEPKLKTTPRAVQDSIQRTPDPFWIVQQNPKQEELWLTSALNKDEQQLLKQFELM